jgi:hypothetical protein
VNNFVNIKGFQYGTLITRNGSGDIEKKVKGWWTAAFSDLEMIKLATRNILPYALTKADGKGSSAFQDFTLRQEKISNLRMGGSIRKFR